MARAARYGNIQPSEFDEMDFEEGAELARRVTLMFQQEKQAEAELRIELTKALLKAQGAIK